MRKRRKLRKSCLEDIPYFNVQSTKGVDKVLNFWNNNPIYFKPIRKYEKNCNVRQTENYRNFNFIVSNIYTGFIYKTTLFSEYPPSLDGLKFSSTSIISTLRDLLLMLEKGEIDRDIFLKNNDASSVFLGSKEVKSPFVEALKYTIKKKKKRESLKVEIERKSPNMKIPKDIQRLIIYWNRHEVLTPFMPNKNGLQSKAYKTTIQNLKRYLKKDLYSSKKHAIFPERFNPEIIEKRDALTYWKVYVDRMVQCISDEKVYPKNKEFLKKFTTLSTFLVGNGYTKKPVSSLLLSYCLTKPSPIEKETVYEKKYIDLLTKTMADISDHLQSIDVRIIDNCLKIIDEETENYYKKAHKTPPPYRIASGIQFVPFLLKKQWKDISQMNAVYISCKGFKQLFRNNFRG